MDVSKAIKILSFFSVLKTAMAIERAQIRPSAFGNIQPKFILRIDNKSLDGFLSPTSAISVAKQIILVPNDFGRYFIAAVAFCLAFLLLFGFGRFEDRIDFVTCVRQCCPASVLR